MPAMLEAADTKSSSALLAAIDKPPQIITLVGSRKTIDMQPDRRGNGRDVHRQASINVGSAFRRRAAQYREPPSPMEARTRSRKAIGGLRADFVLRGDATGAASVARVNHEHHQKQLPNNCYDAFHCVLLSSDLHQPHPVMNDRP